MEDYVLLKVGWVSKYVYIKVPPPPGLLTLAVDIRRHFSVRQDYVLLKGGWVAKACIKVSGHLQWISVVTFLPSTHALVYCW